MKFDILVGTNTWRYNTDTDRTSSQREAIYNLLQLTPQIYREGASRVLSASLTGSFSSLCKLINTNVRDFRVFNRDSQNTSSFCERSHHASQVLEERNLFCG